MATIFGYARCSTDESRQNIDRQKRDLFNMGVKEGKNLYFEYESGSNTERAELQKLLDSIQEGDTIATTEVSRLTRSTKQLCEILQFVQDKKIRLIIGTFIVDCRAKEVDPMTKGMLMMLGIFSEMERDMISQRVRSGMRNAAAKGKKLGRPKTTITSIPVTFWKYYMLYKDDKITITEMARLMDCSRTTIYKYIDIVKSDN